MVLWKTFKSPSSSPFQFPHPSRIRNPARSATSACAFSVTNTSKSPPNETFSALTAYRLSLLSGLARRSLVSAARNVTLRIITASSSLEAAAALNYALSVGVLIDFGRLLRSLVVAGELLKAEALFRECSKEKVYVDSIVLNSMVECYCRLGKLDMAESYLGELVKIGSFPTARVYVAVLRAQCGEEKFVEGFNLFCAMAAQEGFLPPLSIYNMMISGLCEIGCLDHARFMFDFMFNLGLELTPRSYKSLVFGLSKGNRVLEAEDVCNKMESRGFWLDRTLCTSIINGYKKEGRMELALKVFNRMKELCRCEPDTYTYNTIIHGFLKLGYVDSAWKLFNQIVERGLRQNVVTYCMMMNWYSKNRRVDRAMELMKEMSESGLHPNLQCYTTLMTSLCLERRVIEVEQLFDKMLDSGIILDHVMFALLIKNLPGHMPMVIQKTLHALANIGCKIDLLWISNLSSCNEGLRRESEVLLEEIMKSDVFHVHLIFNVLLCVLCREGKFNVACTFMEKMVSWGHEPSISTYNFLIRCMCKEGQLDDVGSLVSRLMHHRGVPSSLATYSIKINALCKIGHVDLALEQLDEMIQKGFDPTVSIYDSIIGSLCRAGRLRKADMTFNSMLKAGVYPDEVVYATLINGHCVLGRAVRACHLFDQMMQRGLLPSSRAYSALINGLIKKNMFWNACHYLDMMLEDGFVPDTILYTMLVNQLLRKGEVGSALDVFDLMLRNKIEPDLVAYGSLICGLCGHKRGTRNFLLTKKLKKTRYIIFRLESRGNVISRMRRHSKKPSSMSMAERVNFALGKVQDLINSGFLPDLHIYNGIINGLCRVNRIEDAYKHIACMYDNGIAPNQVTCTILMKAFIRSGDINCAVWLFNQMNSNGCIPDKISYNALILGFCIAGRVLEGLSLTHGMQKRGLLPNKILYNQLLKSLIPCCPNNLAILLLEEMISHNYVPHSSNYNRLLWVLSTRTNLLELRRVYNLILKIGRIPDENTKRQLLKTCYSRGEFNMALNIEENMHVKND